MIWGGGVDRTTFASLAHHAATSIRNCVRGLLCTSRAPGTTDTATSNKIPRSLSNVSVTARRERDFGLGSPDNAGHPIGPS